jgi:hypothetical protein
MPTHVKDIVSGLVRAQKMAVVQQERIARIVEPFLGKKLSKYVRVQGINKGKLIFFSKNSGAGFELNLQKNKIVNAVQKEFPEIIGMQIKIE